MAAICVAFGVVSCTEKPHAGPLKNHDKAAGRHAAECCDWPTAVFAGCSGVLVHPRVLVTAAHCLVMAPGPGTQAIFGEDTADPAMRIPIERCMAHPGFRPPSSDLDIGFCVLSVPAPTLNLVMPIASDGIKSVRVGQNVQVVGFTSEKLIGKLKPKPPKKGWVEAAISEFTGSQTALIRPAGVSACSGDSGGPVFVQVEDEHWALLGLVSAAVGAPCESPIRVVLVTPHLEWITTESGFVVDAGAHAVEGATAQTPQDSAERYRCPWKCALENHMRDAAGTSLGN